jgi:hypothetical protein
MDVSSTAAVTTALAVTGTAAAPAVAGGISAWVAAAYAAVTGVVAIVIAKYKSIVAWFGTAQGQEAEVLLEDAAPVVIKAIQAGHPGAVPVINAVLASLPKAAAQPSAAVPAPSAAPSVPPAGAALLIGFLLLASHAFAAAASPMEMAVPVSPSAGASYIENTWVTMATMFDVNHGDFNAAAAGFYIGWQTTWQWGANYGAGLTLGGDVNVGTPDAPVAGHVCGGPVFNFETIEVGILADNHGGHVGFSKSW